MVLKNLDHPNIIRLLDVFTHEEFFYFVTELCQGNSLQDVIDQRLFAECDCAVVLKQILQAVTYCHQRNIAHRDIKPANILLQNKNQLTVKLIDFGAACYMRPFQNEP